MASTRIRPLQKYPRHAREVPEPAALVRVEPPNAMASNRPRLARSCLHRARQVLGRLPHGHVPRPMLDVVESTWIYPEHSHPRRVREVHERLRHIRLAKPGVRLSLHRRSPERSDQVRIWPQGIVPRGAGPRARHNADKCLWAVTGVRIESTRGFLDRISRP